MWKVARVKVPDYSSVFKVCIDIPGVYLYFICTSYWHARNKWTNNNKEAVWKKQERLAYNSALSSTILEVIERHQVRPSPVRTHTWFIGCIHTFWMLAHNIHRCAPMVFSISVSLLSKHALQSETKPICNEWHVILTLVALSKLRSEIRRRGVLQALLLASKLFL